MCASCRKRLRGFPKKKISNCLRIVRKIEESFTPSLCSFVNHGDDGACTEFTRCLNEDLGCRAYAPYSGTVYDLAHAGPDSTVVS